MPKPNSSGVKPDLGLDQDQQCKINNKLILFNRLVRSFN